MKDNLNLFTADLHIHTCLSPCAELEMSPKEIVKKIKKLKIDIVAITDHNSSLNIQGVRDASRGLDFKLFYGMEITTREEVHLLGYFYTLKAINDFQKFLDSHLENTDNPKIFEEQVIANGKDEVLGFCKKNLYMPIDLSIEQTIDSIHSFKGIAIPAHIDRMGFGIVGQLGFIKETLKIDGIECYDRNSEIAKSYLKRYPTLTSSDAHKLDDIGKRITIFKMKDRSFKEFKFALRGEKGRRILFL